MKHISSRHHSLVARCRFIARGKEPTALLLEGAHLVGEALAARFPLEQVLVASEAVDRPELRSLVTEARRAGIETLTVSAPVMAAISPVRTPSGIVALGTRPGLVSARPYAKPFPLVVVACDVQDPGNVGAMVRVAEAGGASGMVAAGSSADPFGWKALRGSMGSALRLPIAIVESPAEAALEARQHGCRVAAAVPRGGTSIFDLGLTGALAVLVGGEGIGLAPHLADQADVRLSIPMVPPVESLNAAVTAALVVYEARRQRGLSVS